MFKNEQMRYRKHEHLKDGKSLNKIIKKSVIQLDQPF